MESTIGDLIWSLRRVTEYGQMETGRILTKDMIISDVCIALHNTKLDHAHINLMQ